MLAFTAAGGAELAYRLDFAEAPYANISFFDAARETILFHLSLRRAEGLAVVNHRPGGAWGAEIRREVTLGPAGDRVTIRFAPPRAAVFLEGRRIFALRREVPGLAGIAWLDLQGGIVAASLAPSGCANDARAAKGEIALGEDLAITGWALDSGRLVQDAELTVAGLDVPLRLARGPAPEIAAREEAPTDRIGIRAALPGRVWGAGDPARAGDPVEVALAVNGRPAGAALTVTRAWMRRRLELIAQGAPDTATAILAVEHARFAGLLADLSPTARGFIEETAARYGLADFLQPGGRPPAAPAAAGRVPPRERVRAAVSRALRAGGDLDAALAGLADLPAPERTRLVAELTGPVAAAVAFETLAARAATLGIGGVGDAAEARATGAAFPWLVRAGRAGELPDAMAAFHVAPGDHIATPALAEALRAVLAGAPVAVPGPTRAAVVEAHCALIDRWAAEPWGRVACRHLIGASVALVEAAPRLPDVLAARVAGTVIRVHGLSAGFWEAMGDRALPPDLAAARDAFGTVAARSRGEAEAEAAADALALFDCAGAPAAGPVRVELLGPAGAAPRPGETAAAAMRREGRDPEAGALRAMAHPFGPEAPDLVPLARRGVAAHYEKLPRAPYGGLQDRAARAARRVLAEADGTAAETGVAALLGDFAALSGPESGHVGLGLGLSLLAGLGDGPAGERLLDGLAAMRAEAAEDATAAPAVRGAAPALCRAEGALAAEGLAWIGERGPLPAMPADWAHTSPLFDTLVVVVSCRATLETRIPAMRAAWLDGLAALGIPWVVVTGAGDGRRRGETVALDAPDGYEGLPDKTLAAIRWVHEATPVAHMLKIDDDAALDADAFFHALAWRKADYHGRFLHRPPGATDRLWHAAKSEGAGRWEPDRSPEPATYADGGTAYALSRRAMGAVLAAADRAEGQALRVDSFMEDKLVGDLLALEGIGVSEEDHPVAIRRRMHPGGLPVPRWENSFFPSAAAPVAQIHLDRTEDQARVAGLCDRPELHPKKVWPTDRVRLRYNSQTLELVSPAENLARAAAAEVAVVAAMRDEAAALPGFLAHYRRLGVGGFLVADNLSSDGTLEALAAEPDVAAFTVDSDYAVSAYGAVWQAALVAQFRLDRWSLLADADELLLGGADLPGLLAGTDFAGVDAGRVFLLDLYPRGPLAGVPVAEAPRLATHCDHAPFLDDWPGTGRFGTTPTWTSATRHRLLPGARAETFLAQKIALLRYRPWMRFSAGLHDMGDIRPARRDLLMGHYKYHAGFAPRAAAEAARGQHFNAAEEYRGYAGLGPEVAVYDPAVSVPWEESPAVRRILAGGRMD